MFENFVLEYIEVSAGALRVRHGGSGPPILLLHGHPRTHMTWGRVADRLADRFTVVCPDLRGFGKSFKPEENAGHEGSSKRAKAIDAVELMRRLGHERFAIVGHDRGSYVAFRAAMDFPDVVAKLVVLDCVPIIEALERADHRFAERWWHWFFFGVAEKPERAILADPDAWYGGTPDFMGPEAYEDFRSATRDPATVHAMVEDYRAGLTIDRLNDFADRQAGRRVSCPTLVLWSKRDDLEYLYGDVLAVWRPWADEVSGFGIDSGHHMPEEAPEALAAAISEFMK
jgi:haloacetate dehalogenase